MAAWCEQHGQLDCQLDHFDVLVAMQSPQYSFVLRVNRTADMAERRRYLASAQRMIAMALQSLGAVSGEDFAVDPAGEIRTEGTTRVTSSNSSTYEATEEGKQG